MGKIVVDVMLKPEILDPQGKAVAAALPRLGFSFATDVRQGKRFEITVDGDVTAAQIAAEVLLANPVIETFTVKAE
jgi:phosphoribosylformylglycinamidine synthase